MYIGKFHKYAVAGICLVGMQNDHSAHIVKLASDALIKKGFKVMIFNAFTDMYHDTPYSKGEASVYHLINLDIVDVLVIMPETIKSEWITDTVIRYARAAKIPVIMLDGSHNGCTNITYDYGRSLESVVEHVITEHKCTDLFFMAGTKGNSFSEERIEAFKRVLARHNIEFNEKTMLGYGDFWDDPTKKTISDLIACGRKMPQAIICANDTMAIASMKALEEHGMKVPDDIIVTGFDAIYQERIYSTTRLTTAQMDADEFATTIADTAYGYIKGNEKPSDKHIHFSMILGQSCGCGDFDVAYTNEKLEHMNKYSLALYDAESKMASFYTHTVNCDKLDELTKIMGRYFNYRAALCLNDDFLAKESTVIPKAYHSVFTENMTAHVIRMWDDYSYNINYPTKKVLPNLNELIKRYNTIMFCPLHFQEQVIGYYAAVADDLLVNPGSFYYVQRLVESINQALENFRIEYLLRRANNELSLTHSIDPLTGIYNRRGYFERISELMHGSKECNVILVSCDMDRLKEINDTYGHSEGDIAISAVANAIKAGCGKDGICARFGGDEFILTVPYNADKQRELSRLIGEIQMEIDKFNRSAGKPYEVSISVGGSYGTVTCIDDINELMRNTDHLMYEQKRLKKAMLVPATEAQQIRQEVKSVVQDYNQRMHKIFADFDRCTYFYMNYIDFKWYVIENKCTPKCLLSSSVGPLRAIWLSGAIYPDDKLLFDSFCHKIRKSFNDGITEKSLSVNIRLCEIEGAPPVWYRIDVHLAGKSGKMEEVAGYIRVLETDEIMNLEIQDYYTTTDNPIMFHDMISQRLNAYPDTKFALIQFDVKRFKLINENYGEDAGTEMLHFLTRQLNNYCSNPRLSARMSGDVFMLLAPYTDKDDILKTISELQLNLKGFREYSYEFVFGIYQIDDRSISVRTMCDCAAMARQSIKKNALESVAFYNKNMQKAIKERKFVESHMKKALDNNEFIIYLQPKFSISSGEAIGYEALVRWQSPECGMIYPDSFIPLFEENGFITKLDAYVWECACMVLRDWIDRHYTPLPISVNVSRANLDNESFLDVLDGLIDKYRLPKHLLELEITESIENDATLRMTEKIKERGFILLMDDFGSGYSSLNTLQDTRFDVLKLDREFFSTHMSNERGKKIIMHTISMSKDVGLGLIAEGVETADQAQFLENCGCDTAQGYLYAKPMPVQDAEKYLKNTAQSKTDNEGVTP